MSKPVSDPGQAAGVCIRAGRQAVCLSVCVLLTVLALPAQAGDLAQGKALSSQCSVCHGKNGMSRDPESPNLAGQGAYYLEKSLVDYQKGLREDRRMSIIAQGLSMEDIKNLAAWYAAFDVQVQEPTL